MSRLPHSLPPCLAVALMLLPPAAPAAESLPVLTRARLRLDTKHGGVTALGFSPDGTILAVGSPDGAVSLYDLPAGTARLTIPGTGLPNEVQEVHFLANGRILAALFFDQTVRLWSAATGKELPAPPGKFHRFCMAASPDGQFLALAPTADHGDPVALWHADRRGRPFTRLGEHDNLLAGMSFSPDGRRLLTVDRGGVYHLWDLPKSKSERTGTIDKGWFWLGACHFTTLGRPLVALCKVNGPILLGDPVAGTFASLGPDENARALAFAPDARMLAVGTCRLSGGRKDARVRLWETATATEFVVLHPAGARAEALAFRPDGRLLATGTDEGVVQLWDLPVGLVRMQGYDRTGVPIYEESLRTFTGHKGAVNSIDFSPDGKLVASGGEDGSVRLWDLTSAPDRFPFRFSAGHRLPLRRANGRVLDFDQARRRWVLLPAAGKPTPVFVVRFAAGLLAALHTDGVVRLWDPVTGKELGTLDHARPALTLAITRDGKTLAVGGTRGFITLWDVATRKRRALLDGHESLITALAFSADGKTLVSGDRAANCVVWDAAKGTVADRMRGPSRARAFAFPKASWGILAACSPDGTLDLMDLSTLGVQPVPIRRGLSVSEAAFAPDSSLLAVAGWARSRSDREALVELWEVAGRRGRAIFRAFGSSVESVAFAPDGQTLATGSDDGTIQLWAVPPLFEMPVPRVLTSSTTSEVRDDHGALVHALAYSPDGKTLATAGADRTIKLWTTDNLERRSTLIGHTGEVRTLAFAPDGKTLASGGGDRTVRLWDVATEKTVRILEGHTGLVLGLAFAPDGKALAVGLSDGRVFVWDAATGKRQAVLTGHKGPVYGVSFTPDGKTLLSAGSDGHIKLWDVAKAAEVGELAHTGAVRGLAVSHDGQWLAVGGPAGVLELWDLPKRKLLTRRPGAGNLVWAVAFAPDGRTLASASLEAGVKVWTIGPDGGLEPAARLPDLPDSARGVVFAPDGARLATTSGGALRVWEWGKAGRP